MIFTMMKSSIALSAILACSVNAIAEESDNNCFGSTVTTTDLNFFNSTLSVETLHEGGILKYENIGVAGGKDIDLVVSVVPGTTYYSEKAAEMNGKNDDFGTINLFTVLGDHESGEGNFRFCFHDHETDAVTTVSSFLWSVYDVDERGGQANGIKEKMVMDLSQTKGFSLYPDVAGSELVIACEDESEYPCAENVRTVFHSSTGGTGSDNPEFRDDLDEQQMKRSIVFAFEEVSCWDFTYDHYCKLEEETDGEETCVWYGGGNFLFSGEAQQVVESGECIIPDTDSPTVSPTETPSIAPKPTNEPTPTLVKLSKEPTPTGIKFPEPECSNDVQVLITSGSTGFPDSNNAVSIVSKDTDTVTVSLNQVWDTESIDSVFYEYNTDDFDTKCYEEEGVTMGSTYADEITIQCLHMSPVARLKICLADNIEKEFLGTGDEAEIPQCCHSEGVPAGTPVVCYTLEISCKPGCEEDDTQIEERRLRGSK